MNSCLTVDEQLPGSSEVRAKFESVLRRQPSYQSPFGEGGRLPRTYRFDPSTVQALDAFCEEQGVWPSSLVEALVLDGLGRLAAGELRLRFTPVRSKVSVE